MDLCAKLKSPSQANAKVMAELFLSSKSKKMNFNAINKCVAAEQQRKKKAANTRCKGRAKCLTTVVLKDLTSTIPKGAQRDDLRKSGHVKELWFRRILSEKEVNTLILDSFQTIKLRKFEYLQCCKDSSLVVAQKQTLNGNEVVTLAGCGCLYLHELITCDVQQMISNAKSIIERVNKIIYNKEL